MAFRPFDQETIQALKKLQSLKADIDSTSPAARIEFVLLVLRFDLYDEIINHELLDDYDMSGRTFECCFEMGDGSTVVHGVIQAALAEDLLRHKIAAMGSAVWDSWYKTYDEVEKALALGFNTVEDCNLHEHWIAEQRACTHRARRAVEAANQSGRAMIDVTPTPLKEGDCFYGFICAPRGGLLSLGNHNDSGGVESVKFTKTLGERVLSMVNVSGVNAKLCESGSPNKFNVCFSGSFNACPAGGAGLKT